MLGNIKCIQLAILFFSITASVGIGKIEGAELSASTVKSIKNPSFKSFIKQVRQNYGKQYASRVEELFRILLKSEKSVASAEGSRFLEFDVIKMREIANDYQAAIVTKDNIISEREKCKISFTPRERCYIYVLKVETTGMIFPLFPRKEFSQQTNSLTPNLTYFVPPMKKWLPFEKGYGREAVILSAFMKENNDIDSLMKYFNTFSKKNLSANKEDVIPVKEIPIICSGIGGVSKGKKKKLRLPFDVVATFMATEYIWQGSKFVKTLIYKRR